MIGFELFRATHRTSRGLFNALAELGAARTAPPRDTREAAHRLAGALGAIGRAHQIAVHVRGEIPRGTALIVSNHISYLDPLVLLPVCPAIPVSKHEVQSWPVIGSIGKALGVAFVERDSVMGRARTLRRLHALLASGVPVLNFPEGTTSPGGNVLPFWRGSFGVAQRAGVPVVPVAIRYRDASLAWCDGATFLPHYLKMAASRRVEVDVLFGPAMPPRTGEPAEDMAARARNAITKQLRSIDAGFRARLSAPWSDAVLPASRVA
jgi:1-acyl-sn-glycerol-3-phosphate acyltransferase